VWYLKFIRVTIQWQARVRRYLDVKHFRARLAKEIKATLRVRYLCYDHGTSVLHKSSVA
jgi:hypothetical protein